MKQYQLILLAGISLMLFSCGNKASQERQYPDAADSTEAMVTSSAARVSSVDSTHQFIRTAELKFKVKNVMESTTRIEDITIKNGGYVAYTQLGGSKDNVSTISVSKDSSLEATTFTVSNDMTIRVPNVKLDTTLREIARLIVFLDYRIIKADDVSLQVLSNKLAQKRASGAEKRLAQSIDKRGKKLGETTAAEEILQNKQEVADEAMIQNLSLEDQMKMSTVKLNIYQRPTIQHELIVNDDNLEKYEPNFFVKLWYSMETGWTIVSELILFIVRLWGLILFVLAVYLGYTFYNIRKKNK